MSSDIQQAETAHQKGFLEEAKRLYSDILNNNSDNVDAIYGLGTLALQQNNLQDAERLLAKALTLEPSAADIAFNYALCLNKSKKSNEAIKAATQSLKFCGTDEVLSRTACQLLLTLNQPKFVVEHFSRSKHHQTSSLIVLAKAQGAMGNWDKSVSLLRKLFLHHPDEAPIAKELSQAAARLRDYPLAIESFGHYMGLISPGYLDHLQFSDLYLMARDVDSSETQLSLAHSIGEASLIENNSDYHLLRARLARLKAEYEEARESSSRALNINPGDGQAWSIQFETAEDDDLKGLVDRINNEVNFESLTPYNHSLIRYTLADMQVRLGRKADAFSNYAMANDSQQQRLQAKGTAYEFVSNERRVDNIIQQFSRLPSLVINDHASQSANQVVPIFVLGMPRSGTTLVERMLSQIDGVLACGEIEAMGFLATRYHQQVNDGTMPLPVDMTSRHWRGIAEQYFDFVGSNAHKKKQDKAEPNLQYITDKMPHNFNHVGMILSMFPTVKVIQLRRDPRDVCLSIYTRYFPDDHNYACNFKALAHAYKLARRLMDHWSDLAPDRVVDVNYEGLVSDPLTEGKRMVSFCNLAWSDECLEFHKDITSSFTFSEMQVREAVHQNRLNRWKQMESHIQPLLQALQSEGCL